MYKSAEKIAKESGDIHRARSRARGVKTLESMIKQALAGKSINSDEIPPVVSIKVPNTPSATAEENPMLKPAQQEITNPKPEPEPKLERVQEKEIKPETESTDTEKITPAVVDAKINLLLERQREYKLAALAAKKSGDTSTALQYVKIIKMFDTVLASARNGEAIDLSDMPPSPNELSNDLLKAVAQATMEPSPSKQENTLQKSIEGNENNEQSNKSTEKPKPIELPPPVVPKTILEALTQRLQKYQAVEANAKTDGNDRKARQNGRIVKQYQDAIKAHKSGKPVIFDELPTPHGFPPIPLIDNSKPERLITPKVPTGTPNSPPSGDDSSGNTPSKLSPMKREDSRVSGNHSNTSVMNKTIELLLKRQKEFKDAALEAKKAGEMEQAKEFLKTFKGIDNLLNVARGGLPVDLSSVCLQYILLFITFLNHYISLHT